MAESGGQERTEQATPQKLRKARERGEVWQSKDLNGFVVLAVMTATIALQADLLISTLVAIARRAVTAASGGLSASVLMTVLSDSFKDAAGALGLLLIVGFAAGLVSPLLQVGPIIAPGQLVPKPNRLNPAEGLKKTFASLPPYIELLKSVAKLIVIGTLMWVLVRNRLGDIARLPLAGPEAIVRVSVVMIIPLVAWSLGLAGAFAVGDLLYQRWNFLRGQRMTKEEVKRQYKDQEGDPYIKSKRKRAHEELLQQQSFARARKADVLVTNPTHYACALRYDLGEESAPRLLAKGQGWIAEELRRIAREEDIPIVRDPSLARALHEIEENEEIPETLFVAVAELLLWVEQLAAAEGRVPSWRLHEPRRATSEGPGVVPPPLTTDD